MHICLVDNCDRPHRARGFCHMHYKRWAKHGNPLVIGRSGRVPQWSSLEERKALRAAYHRDYYARKGFEYHRAYLEIPENKERHRRHRKLAKRRYRERLLQVTPGNHLSFTYSNILMLDPCCICGNKTEHIDHIVPVSLGGDGTWENLTGMCAHCNQSKNNKPLLIWMTQKCL